MIVKVSSLGLHPPVNAVSLPCRCLLADSGGIHAAHPSAARSRRPRDGAPGATALADPERVERRRSGSGNQEIDAATRAYVDFENAVSVASMLLLTEATLTELPEPMLEPGEDGGDTV
jgi:hypothetical protein